MYVSDQRPEPTRLTREAGSRRRPVRRLARHPPAYAGPVTCRPRHAGACPQTGPSGGRESRGSLARVPPYPPHAMRHLAAPVGAGAMSAPRRRRRIRQRRAAATSCASSFAIGDGRVDRGAVPRVRLRSRDRGGQRGLRAVTGAPLARRLAALGRVTSTARSGGSAPTGATAPTSSPTRSHARSSAWYSDAARRRSGCRLPAIASPWR